MTALALLVVAVGAPWSCAEREDRAGNGVSIRAVRGPLDVRVRARGELEAVAASPIAVPPVPSGALKVASLAPEGSVVQAGDTVIVFDDTQLNLELDNQQSSYNSTERRTDRTRLQSAIESGAIEAMKDVAILERDHAGSFKIDDDVIYSRLEILAAALGKEFAEEKITFADASLVLRGQTYDIDERILGVEKTQLLGKIERAKTSLGSLVLKAPIGGMIVYKKNWRGAVVGVGDTLWPGNVVMSIVDPTRTALRAFVLEKDAAGLEAGAVAEVRVDAVAEQPFRGKVRTVAKLSRPIAQGSPVKYFEAVIDVEDGDPDILKPGMKGEASILVTHLDEAVVVPRTAVRGGETDPHVVVADAKGSTRTPVKLGPGDLVRVSVREGLAGGESLLIDAVGGDAGLADDTSAAPAGGGAAF